MAETFSSLRSALAVRYRLERELGRGGMATVYLAHDLKHDRPVALKVLHPDLASALGPDRFEREIKLAARLQHPHILSVHDSGETDGQLWFTMPYVAGESLRDRLEREQQLPVEEAVRIAREVAEALDYAHRHGVVHRDVKPENILLAEGHALVADFGIARPLADDARPLTGTGVSIGTPAYMSPEQASGMREVDARTDVYALGCVLFEMLAGEPPYTGPTPQAILARALTETPRPLHPMRPAVPQALDAVIAKAMAATAADRHGSGSEFARALELKVAASTSRPWRDRRWIIGVGVASALVLVAAGTWLGVRLRAPLRDTDAPMDLRHVVAVLPFRDLSGDSSQSYFAAGITEEIAGQVSRIAALRVLSRGATALYQSAPDRLRRLATELGVGSVIEGTTRLSGGHVRIGVSLTDARSGQSVWSDQYDRELRDVLAVESEVAKQIAAALEATLTTAEARRFERQGTQNPEAYELYLRSEQLSHFSPLQNRAGIELLGLAIKKDSAFARGWASLARRYYFMYWSSGIAYADSGLVAADRAAALDSDLPLAHFARGQLLVVLGRLEFSRLAFFRALELDPSFSWAMMELSILEYNVGRFDQSLYWAMRAVPLDPKGWLPSYHASIPLIMLGDDAASERWLAAAVHRFSDVARLELQYAWLDFLRGRERAAIDRVRRLVVTHSDNQEPPLLLAELAVLMTTPDAERVVDSLYRAAPENRGWALWESFRSLYGLVLRRRGERDRAQALWSEALAAAERIIGAGNESFSPRFEIAAICAARGDTSTALEWLDRAYQAGWREAPSIARDPFFEGLREHPRFREIVARAQADVDAMRRRAEQTHPALFRAPADVARAQ